MNSDFYYNVNNFINLMNYNIKYLNYKNFNFIIFIGGGLFEKSKLSYDDTWTNYG